jgi:hypothetical protein
MTNEELLQVIAKAAKDKATELSLSGQGLETLPPEIGQLIYKGMGEYVETLYTMSLHL